jgi:methenyltetrahydrofolate cyclohydrolase
MAAYGLPKETDEEKMARTEAIQTVLKAATEVPLDCARACAEAIELSRCAANKGNLGVISDAGAAVLAGYSGLKSAALNVYINTGSLKDKQFVDAKLAELETILKDVDIVVEDVYQTVKTKL